MQQNDVVEYQSFADHASFLVPLQQPLDVLEPFKIVLKLLHSHTRRVGVVLDGVQQEVVGR